MTPIRNAMLREHFLADYLEDIDPYLVVNNFEAFSDVLSCPEHFPDANIEWIKAIYPDLGVLADRCYSLIDDAMIAKHMGNM